MLNNLTVENGWDDWRINVSVITAILFVILFCIWDRRRIKKRKRNKIIAIERNHIIQAKLIKTLVHYDKDNNKHTSGRYEYTVDGVTKYKHIHSTKPEVPLYYVNSPKKVFSDYNNYKLGCGAAIIPAIGVILLMMYLTGYFANP